MSDTDNMRIVSVLSTMLVYKHFINFDFKKNYKPVEPERVIDKIKTC